MKRNLPMFVIALATLVLAACAGNSPKPSAPTIAILDSIEDVAAENGDRILVIRDYVDDLKTEQGDVRQRFQYAWNYTRGVAQLRVFEMSGALVRVDDQPGLSLVATDAEKAFAFSAVRADPRWQGMYRDDSTFYGGFIFRPKQHPVCGPGARCIHVFASDTGGAHTTLHLIFDLMSGYMEAAAPHVDPSGKTILKSQPEASSP
jgi:hypothetical protein